MSRTDMPHDEPTFHEEHPDDAERRAAAPPADAEADERPRDDVDRDEAERDLLFLRPALMRAHPFRNIVLIAVVVGALVLGGMALWSDAVAQWWVWLALVVGLAAAGYWLVWWAREYLSVKLRVTNKRTIHQRGFVSRYTSEVLHRHIRNVRIDQNLMQRVFNVGRLRIDSSAGGGDYVEIEMNDVPDPHGLKELIDPYRRM